MVAIVGGALTVIIIAPCFFYMASKAFEDNDAEKCTGDNLSRPNRNYLVPNENIYNGFC